MRIEEIKNFGSSLDLFEAVFESGPYPFLLDSGMGGEKLGRFSFMGAGPFLVFRSKGRLVEIEERSPVAGRRSPVKRLIGNPFLVLKELLRKYSNDFYHEEIPFLGGAVGYFSYDLCHFLERLPSTAIDDIGIPDCCVGFYDEIVAVDHLKDKMYVIASPEHIRFAQCKLREGRSNPFFGDCFASSPAGTSLAMTRVPGRHCEEARRADEAISTTIESNFLKESYLAAIERAKEYIRQGDIYQVNLSQRFDAELTMPPFELYSRLRQINPAPFAAYLDFDEVKIISSSPERFLKVDAKNQYSETRPIKGTRPRGVTPEADKRLEEELRASPKDRAEHIMIVDLERNDLGRVCEYGSVKWSGPLIMEKYATVSHLVSTVSGRLKDGVDAADCLMNCFPGGSVTGAPKIRSMEIIDELEPTKRSVYTGAIGYIGFNGNMDTNIAIRTIVAKKNKLFFQAGGGIVADSEPEAEYQETLDKARALVEAIGVGVGARHAVPLQATNITWQF